ncbi:MAG: 3-carboxy-cis,cis-muconate cycloisomerase, partial [Candidatus Promineifilaceae bacterium]|nr:3-carboxy-cis,cis-muconate cycloisomerase [Candidatus Promineifilaceae bacterium]
SLMSDSPGKLTLLASLFGENETGAIFSDAQFVRYMLAVEGSLALAQGKLGIIPVNLAEQIAAGSRTLEMDNMRLSAAIEKAGVPVSELVRQLRRHVGDDAADFVHWGATTQDIMDTARVLQVRAALIPLEIMLKQLITNLAVAADQHRSTLMVGRTHSQQALPITFGLKAAGWLAPLTRHRQRLSEFKPRLLVVQFGGAAGTLAALEADGPAVIQELAALLELGVPLGVWHTQRDTFVEFAGWLSLITGSLAKMAQDIILMTQNEVGEIRESADRSRGGSSTMPQKSNPMVSESILATHRTNVAHLSALHNALVHEHERATHSWQVEWLNLPPMVIQTAAALKKAVWLTENFVINEEQMLKNVAASKGMLLGEAIAFALADFMPRAQANLLIHEAVQVALAEDRHLIDVLHSQIDLPIDWATLRDERNYLGSYETFIERILNESQEGGWL